MDTMTVLNWLKDAGIGVATLWVMGRLMGKLVQASLEIYKGIREDNQQRNRQIDALLSINQNIAGHMELTRQAVERGIDSSQQQDRDIRANTDSMEALREEVVTRMEGLGKQLEEARQDILRSIERMAQDVVPEGGGD